MYNTSFPARVDAVTVLTAGDDDNKMHGVALKLLGTATVKEEFADLGYGKGAEYLDALLNGDIPVDDAVKLRISPRKDLKIKFDDHDMKGVTVPIELVSIRVWPRVGASWEFEIKTKSYHLKDEVAGRLINAQRTLCQLTIWTTQGQVFDEKIEFSPIPDYVPPAGGEKDTDQTKLDLDAKKTEPEKKTTLPKKPTTKRKATKRGK
jgi:hypothetical protein